jgi:hypothetical protein
MPYLVGQLVGAFIAVWLFSRLIEWAVLKRFLNNPVFGKVGSVLAALLVIEVIYYFTSYSPFNSVYPTGAASYAFAALVWAVFGYAKGAKLRDENWEDAPSTNLDETFG